MKCAIMQPTFNPWLGYFDLIDQSDVFVLYDDVQLSKQSWQVRNRIKAANGELFLSIPYVKVDNWRDLLICEAQTNESLPWRKKHLKSIENSYRKATCFDEIFSFTEELYNSNFYTLSAFNSNLIKRVASKMSIKTHLVHSSQISDITGNKDIRLANMCKHLGATYYLSPQGSADYIEEFTPGGELVKSNIDVFYHNYSHPIYTQINGDFIPYMGMLDLLFNVGFEKSLEVIRSGRQEPINYKKFRSH